MFKPKIINDKGTVFIMVPSSRESKASALFLEAISFLNVCFVSETEDDFFKIKVAAPRETVFEILLYINKEL